MIRGALASSLASLGSGVLRHCRVAPASATLHRRRFSEPSSSLLDKAAVADRVLALLQRLHKIEPSKVSMSAHFQKDLGLDSLDTVELVMALEEEFSIEIPDTEAEKISTCEQAILFIASQPKAK